jgi:hypothetical protein
MYLSREVTPASWPAVLAASSPPAGVRARNISWAGGPGPKEVNRATEGGCPGSLAFGDPGNRETQPDHSQISDVPVKPPVRTELANGGVLSGLAANRPQWPLGTIILYPQECHPERSEGSAVAFENSKAALLPNWRRHMCNLDSGPCGIIVTGSIAHDCVLFIIPEPFYEFLSR